MANYQHLPPPDSSPDFNLYNADFLNFTALDYHPTTPDNQSTNPTPSMGGTQLDVSTRSSKGMAPADNEPDPGIRC